MMNMTDNPLAAYTVDELADELHRRGFPHYHVIIIDTNTWSLEHPIDCRLQAGPSGSMLDTCDVHELMADGAGEMLWRLKGTGRFMIDYEVLREAWDRVKSL